MIGQSVMRESTVGSKMDVHYVDGKYIVEHSGEVIALGWPGGGALPLIQGWLPKRVHLFNDWPIRVLELENDTGQEAVWFLNTDFVYLTNDFEKLPQEIRKCVQTSVGQSLTMMWREFAVSSTPAVPPEAKWLNDLGRAARKALVSEFNEDRFPGCKTVVLSEQPSAAPDDSIWTFLDLTKTTSLLETDLLAAYVAAINTGLLQLPSPVDGRALYTDVAYILTSGVVAHRFCDTRYGQTFYVVAGLWRGEIMALYLPTLGRCIYRNNRTLGHSKGFLGAEVHSAIARHIFDYSHLLGNYFGHRRRSPIVKYHQDHLGHHLWNELSGVEHIVNNVSESKLPKVFICGAAHSEMYGPVDKIFPELSGRVTRLDTNMRKFAELCYREGHHVLLACSQYVSRSLAQRIVALPEANDELRMSKERYESLRAQGFRIVMFGLRVENRTVVNIGEFVQYVVALIAQELGKVAIVIDGHNSMSGDTSRSCSSYAERTAVKPPMEVENEVVDQLRERFKGEKSIAVLSTIGAPISESIFWCNRSVFFITPWGAGLAKYRWVCNQRGLVLTSPHFLREAGEETIHLYDSPMFMEHPTPLEFVSPTDVQDEPDSALLVDTGTQGRRNFSVHRAAFARRVKALISKTIANSTELPALCS